MGRYTIYDDPRVDEYIEEQLKVITDILVKEIPDVQSIILGGGFGRGEGSVLIHDQKIELLRDFDIFIVFKSRKVPWKIVREVQEQLHERLNIQRTHKYELMEDFHVDLGGFTMKTINMYPDTHTYDLKYNQILYGEDIRSQIRWNSEDIPLRCGIRILLEQLYKLTCAFSYEYLEHGIPSDMERNFIRETSKIYIYTGAALSVLINQYTTFDLKRVETLRNSYTKEFHDLYKVIPDLVEKIDLSTKYKLNPVNDLKVNALDYWFETRNDLEQVIKYCFKNYMSISCDNWIDFSNILKKKLTKEFYTPLIDIYLKSKALPQKLCPILNYLYNLKDNIDYSVLAFKNKNLSISLIKGISSPSIKLFSVLPLVLFSVDLTQKNNINKKYINEALNRLSFVKLNKKPENPWDEAKLKVLELNKLSKITI